MHGPRTLGFVALFGFLRLAGYLTDPLLSDREEMNWICAGEFQEIGESRGRRPALTGQTILSKYRIEDPAVIAFAAQARLRWRLTPLEPRRGGRIALRVTTAGISRAR